MNFKFLPKNLTKYKWDSIFVRYMLVLLITFLIILAITSAILLTNVNTLHRNNNDRLFDKITFQAQNSIDKVENSVIKGTSALVGHNKLTLITNSYDITNDYFLQAYDSISEILKYMHLDSDFISSVYIYATNSNYVYVINNAPVAASYIKNFADKEILKIFENEDEPFVFRNVTINGVPYTYLTYSQKTSNNAKPSGYIVYNIDVSQFFKMFNCPAHLIDKNNNILFSTNDTVFNSTEKLQNAKSTEIHAIPFAVGGYSVVLENPETRILISPWTYFLLVLFVIVVAFFLAFFIATVLYNHIDKICKLVQSPFAMQDNNSKVSAECSFINSKLQDLVLKSGNMNDELTRKLMQLNDIQATALQLQISPHFLFNTLNLISSISLAESNKDTKITIVVDLLSKMLSTILDTSNLVCSLEDELTYTKQYIEIQKYKYEDFDVIWNINKNDLNIPIVKFTLQPIIENAIHHGISGIENGIIVVSGTRNKFTGKYEITITDNGFGITNEKEKSINSNLQYDSSPKTSIGLWNTNKRLQILLGKEYGCKIKALEKGTSVIITLPFNN